MAFFIPSFLAVLLIGVCFRVSRLLCRRLLGLSFLSLFVLLLGHEEFDQGINLPAGKRIYVNFEKILDSRFWVFLSLAFRLRVLLLLLVRVVVLRSLILLGLWIHPSGISVFSGRVIFL